MSPIEKALSINTSFIEAVANQLTAVETKEFLQLRAPSNNQLKKQDRGQNLQDKMPKCAAKMADLAVTFATQN